MRGQELRLSPKTTREGMSAVLKLLGMGSLIIAVDACFNPLGKGLLKRTDRHGSEVSVMYVRTLSQNRQTMRAVEDHAKVMESFTPASPRTTCHSGCAQDLKCCLALLSYGQCD